VSQRGSVRRRNKTWTAYWWSTDPTGRRVQRSKGGFRTRAEAQRHLTHTLNSLQTGSYVEPSNDTVNAYLTSQWLPAIQASVRPSSLYSYRRNIELHVLPTLGGVRLQQLTADRLNTLYAELLRSGNRGRGGGLSPKTVRYIHTILHKALKDAVRWGRVPRNVASDAEPPKLSAGGKNEMRTWTAEQLREFLLFTSSDRLSAAFLLAGTTGMRRGEVLGLRWSDVDLERASLTVRRSLITVAYVPQFSEPKTRRSVRVIQLDPVTVKALRVHKAKQAEERLAWGVAYLSTGLVFARENGALIHPERFTQLFDLHVKNSKLDRIRLHDLRHTHATLALSAGVPPKIISDRLGHSTVAFTQDVYIHAIPSMQSEAAAKVADLIFGESN